MTDSPAGQCFFRAIKLDIKVIREKRVANGPRFLDCLAAIVDNDITATILRVRLTSLSSNLAPRPVQGTHVDR
jgi:hypothetical protein